MFTEVAVDMPGETVLYSYWRSSCSWRVRAALCMKKVKYVYKAVNLERSDQKEEVFVKVNPYGKVPTLVHNGNAISESPAILEYLEEVLPTEAPLLPSNPVERAQVRSISSLIVSGIQPLQNVGLIRTIEKQFFESKVVGVDWAKFWIEDGFRKLEPQLQLTAGEFCFRNTLTLADLCLAPQVHNAQRYGVDIDSFPTIKRINEKLLCLPVFIDTHPDKQPDAPKKCSSDECASETPERCGKAVA